MGRVLTIGETMGVAVTAVGDPVRTARDARLSIAGAESTVAIGLRRLGIESCWVGVVGADEFGRRILRELAAEGVDVSTVRVHAEASTGFMLRELRTSELTRVTYYRSGSAGSHLDVSDIDRTFAAFNPDLVHITGITAALSESAAGAIVHAVRCARDVGAEVSLDANHRATLPRGRAAIDVLRDVLPDVDVLFVGVDELHVLPDGVPLTKLGPAEVVVKRGVDGATVFAAGVELRGGAFAVAVADVIGAGDSFVAGYLAARAEQLPIAQRLHWASVCAAFTVGTHGDWEGLPTRAELAAFDGAAKTVR